MRCELDNALAPFAMVSSGLLLWLKQDDLNVPPLGLEFALQPQKHAFTRGWIELHQHVMNDLQCRELGELRARYGVVGGLLRFLLLCHLVTFPSLPSHAFVPVINEDRSLS